MKCVIQQQHRDEKIIINLFSNRLYLIYDLFFKFVLTSCQSYHQYHQEQLPLTTPSNSRVSDENRGDSS